jgi:hypothetical protein
MASCPLMRNTRSRGALLLLAGLIDRPDHQATPPPRTAGRLIQPSHREPAHHPIAAKASHTARLSSRWVPCGLRSPAWSAIVHPFRFARPLATAATYLPACSHGSTRTKHPRSSSARFCWPSPAPILAAPAALDCVVVTYS